MVMARCRPPPREDVKSPDVHEIDATSSQPHKTDRKHHRRRSLNVKDVERQRTCIAARYTGSVSSAEESENCTHITERPSQKYLELEPHNMFTIRASTKMRRVVVPSGKKTGTKPASFCFVRWLAVGS